MDGLRQFLDGLQLVVHPAPEFAGVGMGVIGVVVFLEFLVEGKGVEQVHAAVIIGLTDAPIEVIGILPIEAVGCFAGFELLPFLQGLVDNPRDGLVDRAGVCRDCANLFEGDETLGSDINPWIGFQEAPFFHENG